MAVAHFNGTSHNRKLSPVDLVAVDGPTGFKRRPKARAPFMSNTYVAIQPTCPSSCPFKRDHDGPNGCFVDAGFTRQSMMKMDAEATELGLRPEEVILEEVRQIDAAWIRGVPQDGARGGRDLRLHVGGDAGNEQGAKLLAGAASRWRARGGGAVFTYTHLWREIPRAAWGPDISVLASIERPDDIPRAIARGYVPAIVVENFPRGHKPFYIDGRSEKVLPCPAETKELTCVDCRLCFDDEALRRRGVVIAFALHGMHAAEGREQLLQIRRGPSLPAVSEPAEKDDGLSNGNDLRLRGAPVEERRPYVRMPDARRGHGRHSARGALGAQAAQAHRAGRPRAGIPAREGRVGDFEVLARCVRTGVMSPLEALERMAAR